MNYHHTFQNFGSLGTLIPSMTGMTGPIIGILSYVLTALALYTLAERRGIRHGWMAWLPVLNLWVLGSLSDQYRYVVRGQIRSKRKALLVLGILSAVLSLAALCIGVVLGITALEAFYEGVGPQELMGMLTGLGLGLGGVAVPLIAIRIAVMVLRYMALYDIYLSCDPQNAVLFLVLSIFIGVTRPFFLFACREKEAGMPPRRGNPEPMGYRPPEEM